MKRIILVDQDGVLADIELGLREAWRKKFGTECPLLRDRRTNSLKPEEVREYHDDINSIIYSEGFIRDLKPIPDSIEAINDLAKKNEVFICTVPLLEYRNCSYEKYAWVERNLGLEWTKKIIYTRDKTLVRAELLIDDAPEVTGLKSPEWEHVIFDAPYNRHAPGRRVTWRNYREVLNL